MIKIPDLLRFLPKAFVKPTIVLLALVPLLTACGKDTSSQSVVRKLFAVGDIIETVEDVGEVTGDVSGNDRGDGIVYELTSAAVSENGTLVFNSDGSFIYTSNPDFFGVDTFAYQATHVDSGETSLASLTFKVENDYERIDEYGWNVVWIDEFEGDALDENAWAAENAIVADGVLVIEAEAGMTSSVMSKNSLSFGRVEASIKLPEGSDAASAFKVLPMADMYEGDNSLVVMEMGSKGLIAGARYGLEVLSGVRMAAGVVDTAATDFHIYAVEWDLEQIRWYVDGAHTYTVDNFSTWAYTLNGEEVVPDLNGPFQQDMSMMLAVDATTQSAAMLVDYIKVFACDPTIAPEVDNCASYVKSSIARAASNRIPELEQLNIDFFSDGLQEISWSSTDEVVEVVDALWMNPVIEHIDIEGERGVVFDVTNLEGEGNISLRASGLELIGRDASLSFDMYIDSTATTVDSLGIWMETEWPYRGTLTWNLADLQLDTWVTYTIPVSDFIDAGFVAPDWLTWIPGVVTGDVLPMDPKNINGVLGVDFVGAVHFQLDNVQVNCFGNDNCFQAPLAIQADVEVPPAGIRYEAESFENSVDVVLVETSDEDAANEAGGQNVTGIDAGEALHYTIVAPIDGTYALDYRVASGGGSEGFEVSIDDVLVDTQTVADTGDAQTWATQSSGEFDLLAGTHNLVISFVDSATNFNWFELMPPPIKIFIEAEDYDEAFDIQLEATLDDGGGENVGWVDPDDYLLYTVNIPADGTYFISYRVASNGGSDGFKTLIGGIEVDSQTVSDTGGWQNWKTQTAEVELLAGEQPLRLDFVGGSINVNWIKISN